VEIIRKLVRSDRDGIVHVDVVGVPGAEYEVVLIYRPVPIGTMLAMDETPEERTRALTELVGSWQGEFTGFRDEGERSDQR